MEEGNGDGSIVRVNEKRRKPYRVRVTTGFRMNEQTKKRVAIRKNHGNAWRIKPYAKSDLFGEIEVLEF